MNHLLKTKFYRLTSIKQFYQKPSKPWYDPKQHEKDKKTYSLYNSGLYLAVFGLCFAAVPLYRRFCEHVGLQGNFDQKDYTLKHDNKNVYRKFNVHFQSETDEKVNWDFQPIQGSVTINAGETALAFYKALNKDDKPKIGFATYAIKPEEATPYFSKIQCFCFNQQMINGKEELQLPIFFYLEPEILDNRYLAEIKNLTITYKLIQVEKSKMVAYIEQEIQNIKKNKAILDKERNVEKKDENYEMMLKQLEISKNQIINQLNKEKSQQLDVL